MAKLVGLSIHGDRLGNGLFVGPSHEAIYSRAALTIGTAGSVEVSDTIIYGQNDGATFVDSPDRTISAKGLLTISNAKDGIVVRKERKISSPLLAHLHCSAVYFESFWFR